MLAELLPWAQSQAEASGYKTVGIYAGALGFGYNEELLKQKNMPVPKCWADLTDPAYRGEVQIANPNSSGTSYTTLATIVRSEEHTSELQSLMRISYAVFCLKNKKLISTAHSCYIL